MQNNILTGLSAEELTPPEYYPLDLAIQWIAYSHKPIAVKYARVVYTADIGDVFSPEYEEAKKALQIKLMAGKVRSRFYNFSDNTREEHFQDVWQELSPNEWDGRIDGHNSKLRNFDEECQIDVTYHNVEICTADLLKNFPQRKNKNDQDLGTREKDTLLKMIIGMAVEQYGFDPKSKRNEATRNIHSDLESCGISMDRDTILDKLRQASDLLPPQED